MSNKTAPNTITLQQKYAGLPDKLWQMLTLALADLSTVEKMKDTYVVEMNQWHSPGFTDIAEKPRDREWFGSNDGLTKPKSLCAVCFGGSVMACTLKADHLENVTTEDFPPFIACKLDACDSARTGEIIDALNQFYGDWGFPESGLSHVDVPDYGEDRVGFRKGIQAMIKQLKAVDL